MRIINFTGITALLVFSAISYADLARMDDKQLGDSTAAGLGFALDDFMLNSDSAVLKVTGINDSTGTEIEVDWSELYIMGEGSESGTNPTTVDIGSNLNLCFELHIIRAIYLYHKHVARVYFFYCHEEVNSCLRYTTTLI